MIPRLILHFIFSSLFVLVLVGCSSTDDLKDLKDQLAEIEAKPKGRIPPPPEFKAFQTFTYQSAGLRSPFERPVEVIFESKLQANASVKPDMQRRKEALERFSLDSMSFVGTLVKEDEKGAALWAIIDDGEGGVHRIKEGNYLGQNHGKVLSITDRRVEVLEIVPSGQLDDEGNKLWIERPRSLVLRDE